MSRDDIPATKARRACPICGKPATAVDVPFCSKRCAEVDLHRWMAGSYALPAEASEADETPIRPAEPSDP